MTNVALCKRNTFFSTKYKSISALHYVKLTVLTGFALVAVGCSSSSGNSAGMESDNDGDQMEGSTTGTASNSGDTIPNFQGVFTINEQRVSGVRTLSLDAGFVESDSRVFYGHQFLLGEDRCQESIGGSSSLPPANISAGDVLVLSNPAGTLAQLDEQKGISLYQDYSTQLESITAEQTVGMTLDIPGDQYPGLPTLPVQDLDELSGILPTIGSEVTAQTVYQWTPSVYPDTLIGLEIFTVQETGSVVLVCSLIDDGNFVFPEFFQSLLGDSTTTNWSMSRSRHVEHIENGAYLEISRTTSPDIE